MKESQVVGDKLISPLSTSCHTGDLSTLQGTPSSGHSSH